MGVFEFQGLKGFDGGEDLVDACRGWSVGLVKSRLHHKCQRELRCRSSRRCGVERSGSPEPRNRIWLQCRPQRLTKRGGRLDQKGGRRLGRNPDTPRVGVGRYAPKLATHVDSTVGTFPDPGSIPGSSTRPPHPGRPFLSNGRFRYKSSGMIWYDKCPKHGVQRHSSAGCLVCRELYGKTKARCGRGGNDPITLEESVQRAGVGVAPRGS